MPNKPERNIAAPPEAKPEPLPNILQEERIALLESLLREHMEAFICDKNNLHLRSRDALAAPKVVDSKEEQQNKFKEIGIGVEFRFLPTALDRWFVKTGPYSADLLDGIGGQTSVSADGNDEVEVRPKVEEQDGELELPPLDRKNARIGNPEAQAKYGGNLTQYQGDFLIQREHQLRAVLRANKLLKSESVAPPSPPKQEFEEWWASYRPFYGYSAVGWEGVARASWNASRAAAPVAPPTHQLVECTVGAAGRYACLRCSCSREFIAIGDEAIASARASFEAHLPEKEGK